MDASDEDARNGVWTYVAPTLMMSGQTADDRMSAAFERPTVPWGAS